MSQLTHFLLRRAIPLCPHWADGETRSRAGLGAKRCGVSPVFTEMI